MFGFIVALVSGALMSIQGVFNTEVTKQTGTWLTNSFVQDFFFALLSGFLKKEKNILRWRFSQWNLNIIY